MSILTWIVFGTFVGLAANWLLPGRFPGGLVGTTVGGMAGAFLGGAIFSMAAGRGLTGLDLGSLGVALVGAALLLTLVRWAGYATLRTR